jgi:hypothetical protein
MQERLTALENAARTRGKVAPDADHDPVLKYGLHARSLWNRQRSVDDILRMLANRAKQESVKIEPLKITPENLLIMKIGDEIQGFDLGPRRTA